MGSLIVKFPRDFTGRNYYFVTVSLMPFVSLSIYNSFYDILLLSR